MIPLKQHSGLTLIELAIAIAVIAVIGLAASQMMFTGVQTQMSVHVNETEANLAQEIVNRLRYELRNAQNIQILNNGNSLQFQGYDPNTAQYTSINYAFTGSTLTRNGVNLSANRSPAFQITCGGTLACFTGATSSVTSSQNLQRVSLNNLTITDISGSNKNLDQAFGGPATFHLDEAAFNILNGMTFQ